MAHEAEHLLPILVVEDDLPTAELEVKVLVRAGRRAHVEARADEAVAELRRNRYSVVLLDYLLADENGWRVLEAAQAQRPPVPVIVVTGKGNEEVAAEALRRGVADYIIKNGDFWEQLPNIVERIEKAAEAERLRSHLAAVVQSSDDAIIACTMQGNISSWNNAASRIFGYSAAEGQTKRFPDLFVPDLRTQVTRAIESLSRGEQVKNFESLGVSNVGKQIAVSITLSAVKNDLDSAFSVSAVIRDISERKRAEEQLRRTEFQLRRLQKFEAIREIAGGVAHEFNNLLTVVIVRSELMKSTLPPENPMKSELDLIIKTGERAALVSRQLLAFSRQQLLRPKNLDLSAAVTHMTKTLQRVLGENIRLELKLDPYLAKVKADPAKFDEVILNLVVNSKDAMPNGGTVTIETSNVFRDADFANRHESFKPGRYALLTVEDTGIGMDADTLSRIFEPFFTTKGRARRTGLGLAMVYGTVKQSDGYLYASSEPGKGARFEIYLPSTELTPKPAPSISQGSAANIANKTILVVEDEANVLEIVTEILRNVGYTLLTASSPKQALHIAGNYKGKIDLLLTDVVMPDMNGPEMAIRLGALHPEMKVLYMSGYPERPAGVNTNAGIEFISKPFSFEGLTRKVREIVFRK